MRAPPVSVTTLIPCSTVLEHGFWVEGNVKRRTKHFGKLRGTELAVEHFRGRHRNISSTYAVKPFLSELIYFCPKRDQLNSLLKGPRERKFTGLSFSVVESCESADGPRRDACLLLTVPACDCLRSGG